MKKKDRSQRLCENLKRKYSLHEPEGLHPEDCIALASLASNMKDLRFFSVEKLSDFLRIPPSLRLTVVDQKKSTRAREIDQNT